jgi:hypothetical protein
MKKISILLLVIAYSALVNSQEGIVIQASNKVKKEVTPKQVIDSLHKLFPNAKSVQYYKTPAHVARNGWEVEEEYNLAPGDEVDMYTISFENEKVKYYALFDAEGHLQMSKYEEYNTKFPEPVKATVDNLIADKYKGYQVLSKTHYKKVNYSKKSEFYEVVLVNKANKKDKKTLEISPEGQVIKEKG